MSIAHVHLVGIAGVDRDMIAFDNPETCNVEITGQEKFFEAFLGLEMTDWSRRAVLG